MLENITFNDAELNYLIEGGYHENYPGLQEILTTPRFTISDIGVTPRDATYWDSKDVLPILKTKNTTRRKYTLPQAVWIKIVQQLRSFDISLNQIKKYKSSILGLEVTGAQLMQYESFNILLDKLSEHAGHLEEYKELLKDPNFLKSIEDFNISVFDQLILTIIVFKRDMSYVLLQDGTCFPYCYDKHNQYKESIEDFDNLMKSPHIVLSITQAIRELVNDWHEKDWFDEISIVSNEEKQILKLLREERTTELRVFKKGNTPERVIQVSEKKIDSIKDLSNQILGNGYQEVTVKTRKGNIVHFKNEVSIKLNN